MSDRSLCTVGFDTSNYTTSASVCDSSGKVILNLKIPLPVKEGERGLRQSDAVYAHVKNQPQLMTLLSEFLKEKNLSPTAIGYSSSPTNGSKSFMPCFLCGKAFALSFSACTSIPVYQFSHQEGHIAAAVYSATDSLRLTENQLLAFHVSGGTTDILLCTPKKSGFDISGIGGSLDLHAGQLVDRIGVMMNIPFPCGPKIEQYAALCDGKTQFTPKISVNGLTCNLSGGENAAIKVYKEHGREACSKFVLDFIASTLDKLSDNLRAVYPSLPIVYSGGVMSNKYISSVLCKRSDTYFAEPAFSADNAAGIALLTHKRFTEFFEV